MTRLPTIVLGLCLPLSMSAQHHHPEASDANAHMHEQPFEDLVAHFEDPSRDHWQQPAEVLRILGDLNGRTVMDIGSGTGYFSFRLARAGARVICADVDERFLHYIEQKRDSIGSWATKRITTRHVPYDSADLAEGEVDLVLIVDTYHHIGDRISYCTEVRRGLKPDGKLVVIDFFKEESPVGPPVEMKLSEETVMQELHDAGFTRVDVDTETLPYQYIITVW